MLGCPRKGLGDPGEKSEDPRGPVAKGGCRPSPAGLSAALSPQGGAGPPSPGRRGGGHLEGQAGKGPLGPGCSLRPDPAPGPAASPGRRSAPGYGESRQPHTTSQSAKATAPGTAALQSQKAKARRLQRALMPPKNQRCRGHPESAAGSKGHTLGQALPARAAASLIRLFFPTPSQRGPLQSNPCNLIFFSFFKEKWAKWFLG